MMKVQIIILFTVATLLQTGSKEILSVATGLFLEAGVYSWMVAPKLSIIIIIL